jgi:uncharacterized protein (DUF433 family)
VNKSYVEQRDGGYWVSGTRVSLDSLVHAFRRGTAPDTIRRSFPVLTLEEVYGALTYYLSHEQEIDEYLRQSEIQFDAQADERRAKFRSENPELYERIVAAREERELVPS